MIRSIAARLPTILLLVMFYAIAVQASTPRTALVIGNGNYQNAPLGNPTADARAVADKLRALDFQVIQAIDVDRSAMRAAIRDFSQLLRTRGGVGLFFYAGHGVQVDGKNFLLPVGVDIQQAFEVPDETLDMQSVLRAMEYAGNEMNVVILDACRNNPFARSFRSLDQGLARMEGPTGSLIAYSTSPGSVAADGDGEHSPYTHHLLEAMDEPGLSLEQVFKRVREGVVQDTAGTQVPWEHSSLLGEFYFLPPQPDTVASEPSPGSDTTSPSSDLSVDPSVEMTFWESIQDSQDPAYFQAYLQQYPQGNFVSLARLKLQSLSSSPSASRSATPPAEAQATDRPVPSVETPTVETATTPPEPLTDDARVQRIVRAAEAGDPIAQGLLGRLLASGDAMPQDLNRAYVWSALAAKRGVKDAEPVRKYLAERLSRRERHDADREVKELLRRYRDRDNPRESRRQRRRDKKDD